MEQLCFSFAAEASSTQTRTAKQTISSICLILIISETTDSLGRRVNDDDDEAMNVKTHYVLVKDLSRLLAPRSG